MNTKEIRSILTPKGSYTSNDMEHYSELTPGRVKAAIIHKNPAHTLRLFDLLEQKDTSIGSEIEKRILSVENKFFVSNLPKYDSSIEEIIKASVHARIFGLSIVELYLDEYGDFTYAMVPKEYYHIEDEQIFLKSGNKKIIPKEPNFIIIKTPPVLLKTVWIAYAKHFVLSHYLKFAEFLGVPPLIVNAHSSDENVISAIGSAVKSIKSGDFAVLSENDVVKVLEGRGSQADFLEFVRYCDTEIAKAINGASLGSNVATSGSYAQSKSHEDNRGEIIKADVRFATRVTKVLFKKIGLELELNIAVEKDIDLLARAQTLEILKNLGYEMTAEQIAYEFDLPNPTQKTEANKRANLQKNSKALTKDEIDAVFEDESFNSELQKSEEEMIKQILKIASECDTYEEVYEKLSLNYKDIEFRKLDELMFKAISSNLVLGAVSGK